jgi:hypothetical protein
METNLVLAVAGILVVILSFMLRSARRKLELYGFLSYDNKPHEVFKAINRLPPVWGKEINFDEDVIKMYFLRYFANVAGSQTYSSQPIVKIGDVFSSLSVIISKKERRVIEELLTLTFIDALDEKKLAEIYFLYLRRRLSDPGRDSSLLEKIGEDTIFKTLLSSGGVGNSHVSAFLFALEELIKASRKDKDYSSISKVFIEGQLVQIRAKLGDIRDTRLEI